MPPECPPLAFLPFLRDGSFSFSTREKRRVGGGGTSVERTKVTLAYGLRRAAFEEVRPVLVSKEATRRREAWVLPSGIQESCAVECVEEARFLPLLPLSSFFLAFLLFFSFPFFLHLLPEGPETTTWARNRKGGPSRDGKRPRTLQRKA